MKRGVLIFLMSVFISGLAFSITPANSQNPISHANELDKVCELKDQITVKVYYIRTVNPGCFEVMIVVNYFNEQINQTHLIAWGIATVGDCSDNKIVTDPDSPRDLVELMREYPEIERAIHEWHMDFIKRH